VTTRIESLGLVAALVVMSFVFQYQLKLLANEVAPLLTTAKGVLSQRAIDLIPSLLTWRPLLIMALALALFLVWFLMLTRLDLSVALPIASITLVVNAVGTGLMLGEAVSALRIAGVVMVAIGLAMVLNS